MNAYRLPINLLIADDHRLIVDGLMKILENEKTIGEIHAATNGREAIDRAIEHNIDCVIMDINMPVLSGLEATKIIKKERPEIKVVIVSMLCDASVVSKLMKAGANAFINKGAGKGELLKAIEKVMNNEKYISPEISVSLLSYLTEKTAGVPGAEKRLTPREIEVVRHIADGLTNHEIADKLFLSPVTVDTHRKNILAKLHLKNTAALVKYAAEHNLL